MQSAKSFGFFQRFIIRHVKSDCLETASQHATHFEASLMSVAHLLTSITLSVSLPLLLASTTIRRSTPGVVFSQYTEPEKKKDASFAWIFNWKEVEGAEGR